MRYKPSVEKSRIRQAVPGSLMTIETHHSLGLYNSRLYFHEREINFHLVFLKFIYLFIYFWLRWVCCCVRAFSSCGEWGLLFVVVHGLLVAVVSLVAEHKLWVQASVVVAGGLSSCGSRALEHRLSSCGARA